MLRPASLLVLLVLLLAGCAGDKPAAAAPDAAADGPEPGRQLVPLESIPAPDWQVGQYWEWQVTHGTQTMEGTFCSIVVAKDGATYTLATENDDWAKDEAAFDHPLLGTTKKGDLVMTGPDGDWSLLSFPLTDGKTWTASMPNLAWDVFLPAERVDVAMAATFSHPTHGEPPLVHITGTSGEYTLLQASYDVRTGWFSDLVFFDVDPGQEEVEVGYHAKSAGMNYTGPYFQHTAKPLLQLFDANGFDDEPTAGGQPYTAPPQPYHSFTVREGTTLYGYIVAETVVAAREVALIDPTNQARHVTATGALDGGSAGLFLDEPAIPGEWRLATGGAGGFSGAFAEIFELTEGSFTL
ncbi:MAG: hypothetical protein QOJ26_1677 [Thermoplasmata archaeon]|nr:hypothetical protein [Thermoplasmata archaeon]